MQNHRDIKVAPFGMQPSHNVGGGTPQCIERARHSKEREHDIPAKVAWELV